MHSERSKTKGPEQLAWPESHTENRGGRFAKESSGWNRPGKAWEGYMEDETCSRQSRYSKTNGPERFAWPESQTKIQGGGFAKE